MKLDDLPNAIKFVMRDFLAEVLGLPVSLDTMARRLHLLIMQHGDEEFKTVELEAVREELKAVIHATVVEIRPTLRQVNGQLIVESPGDETNGPISIDPG